jgi:hypothetical protein
VESAVFKEIYKFSHKSLLLQFDKRKYSKIKMLQKELVSRNHHHLQYVCQEQQKMELNYRSKGKDHHTTGNKAQRGSRRIALRFL